MLVDEEDNCKPQKAVFFRDLFHVVIVMAIMFSHMDCFTINMFL